MKKNYLLVGMLITTLLLFLGIGAFMDADAAQITIDMPMDKPTSKATNTPTTKLTNTPTATQTPTDTPTTKPSDTPTVKPTVKATNTPTTK